MSIDEFSAAIGTAAESAEIVASNIANAGSAGEGLAAQIGALGMAGSRDRTEAVRQRLETEAMPLAIQLHDLLTQIQQEALALRDGAGLPRGGTSPRTATDRSPTAAEPNPVAASLPKPTRSHGTQQKRAGADGGPVRFSIPRKMEGRLTGDHRRQVQEYIDAANQALADGRLSETGRVRPSRDPRLKNAKEAAAARERARADKAGRPYGDKVAAHLPDTTWSGTAEPPGGWGRHDAEINASLGSQSDKYPEGYRPTRFEMDATWDTVGPDESDRDDLP